MLEAFNKNFEKHYALEIALGGDLQRVLSLTITRLLLTGAFFLQQPFLTVYIAGLIHTLVSLVWLYNPVRTDIWIKHVEDIERDLELDVADHKDFTAEDLNKYRNIRGVLYSLVWPLLGILDVIYLLSCFTKTPPSKEKS